ncbi:MAG TPA: hypothetical protein VF307_05140 [Candidatus Nanopelagicaceae bacterium]
MRHPDNAKIGLFSLLIVVGVVAIVWITDKPGPEADFATEPGRVLQAFSQISLAVAQEEGLASLNLAANKVDDTNYPDGTNASLWAIDPDLLGIREHCFYVDEVKNGAYSGYSQSLCAVPGSTVDLDRQGSVVVGFIGLAPVQTVSITVNDIIYKVPVTNGYFLIPGAIPTDVNTKFTISYLTKPGGAVASVTDLVAPGSASPVYVIASRN